MISENLNIPRDEVDRQQQQLYLHPQINKFTVTKSAEVQFVLLVQNKHRRALLLVNIQTIYRISRQTNVSPIYRHKHDETSSFAYYSGETQTCSYLF